MTYRCDECKREYELPEHRLAMPDRDERVYEAAGPYYCGEHSPFVQLRKVDPEQEAEAAICAKRGHQPANGSFFGQQGQGSLLTCRWCGKKYRPIQGCR